MSERPREESNLYPRFRRPVSCPLDHEGGCLISHAKSCRSRDGPWPNPTSERASGDVYLSTHKRKAEGTILSRLYRPTCLAGSPAAFAVRFPRVVTTGLEPAFTACFPGALPRPAAACPNLGYVTSGT